MSIPALHARLSMAEYLASAAYGSSDLRAFRTGPPAMVPWGRQHRDSTSATTIGSAVAAKLLEPETFPDRFVVKPEGMEFRSKENKALRDEWLASGLEILSQADMVRVKQILEAITSKEEVLTSIRESLHCEASIFWDCAHSGLRRKGRPDWFDAHAVYDLKISIHATKEKRVLFLAAQRDGWLEQLAHNRAGLRACGYPDVKVGRLIVVAPQPPQGLRTWLFEVSEQDLDLFELQNEAAAAGIKACEEARFFPGTPEHWEPFEVLGVINEMSDDDLSGAEEETEEGAEHAPF